MDTLNDLCRFLEWDSEFFGHRIARVNYTTVTKAQANTIDQWCVNNNIACLYFLTESQNAETVRIVEDHQYRYVDTRVIYEFDLTRGYNKTIIDSDMTLDTANINDTKSLLPMIDNAFIHTRFYYDANFDNAKSNDLYQTWLKRSIDGSLADRVLVIRQQKRILGFITCSLDHDSKIGSIGLVGVADFARGQNLGAKLVLASFDYFKQENMQQVQVVTQGRNIPANRLYQKCGMRTMTVNLWYHKWF